MIKQQCRVLSQGSLIFLKTNYLAHFFKIFFCPGLVWLSGLSFDVHGNQKVAKGHQFNS